MSHENGNQDTSSQPAVICRIDQSVASIILNRPDRRNALSFQMLKQIRATLMELSQNRDVRAVVLSANGKVFCAGHDLKEMTHGDQSQFRELFELCSEVMQLLRTIPQPIIAKVHALATAAGCQLVAACDMAVATPQASFATPGVKIGLFCSTPMVPLVRSIPAKPALEMLLTGKPISAQRALELGLVNHVVDDAEIDERITELTDAIVASSPTVIALGKRAFYDQLQLGENSAYEKACEVMTNNATMFDAQEGISAFLEKRQPSWSDETVIDVQ